jgi:catechol 2,3-dioxygenase-like lactoylglutathione lyase family enzyme
MLDHITITASDYAKSRAFYEATLASLNMKPLYEEKDIVTGFGVDRPIFWSVSKTPNTGILQSPHSLRSFA